MNRNIIRRIRIIGLIFGFFYLIILINLFVIQVKDHSFYVDLAHKQYRVTIKQYPPRAAILDRNGNYLAMNKKGLAAFITPNNLTDPHALMTFLAEHFPKALERLKTHPDSSFMYIQRRLTPEQCDLITQANVVDIKFLAEPSRFYPIGAAASSLVGITDIDNNGLFGIELHFNDCLAGLPSTVTLERDARSGHFYFAHEVKIAGNEGDSLKLTIDSTLQFLAHEQLNKTMANFNAKSGAVIIMDPITGDILAMVTSPSIDPHILGTFDLEQTKNSSITDAYELGSVIKVFAALGAIQEGVVTLEEQFDCKNSKTAYIDGRKINTVLAGGLLTLPEIMEQSNNIGVAQVAKRLGPKLYDHYCRLGFGQKTHIAFPGEQRGFVNHPKNWSKQSIISLSYGYEIRATLLQLARAFCIIARNGTMIEPRLVLEADNQQNQSRGQQLYSPESMATIQKILEGSATKRRRLRPSLPEDIRVMSKTGTAQLLVNGVYSPAHHIYTCAGIVEKGDYKRVMVTFIKEIDKKNLLAAAVAAPLFDVLAEKMVIHDRII